jgi:hypothetical protein
MMFRFFDVFRFQIGRRACFKNNGGMLALAIGKNIRPAASSKADPAIYK